MRVPTRRARAGRWAALAALVVGLTAAPLPQELPAQAQAAEGSVTITPTTRGNTAVQAGQSVDVSGRVPSGSLGSAALIGLFEDGTQAVQRVPFVVLQTSNDPIRGGDYLRVDDGQLSGRLTLDCLFSAPKSTCRDRPADSTAEVRQVLLEVVVDGQSFLSGPLRVDYVRPRIRDAALEAVTRVRVRITEPVRSATGQTDNPLDWTVTVDGRPVSVLAVEGPREGDCVGGYRPDEDETAGPTGCTRTLVLGTPVDEDSQPVVDYTLIDDRVPGRMAYEDFASNRLFHLGTGTRLALDEVRPPTPRIERVDGEAPQDGRVVGSEPSPQLEVSNLRQGHTVLVERVLTDGPAVQGAPVVASGERATVIAPALVDGANVLRVVVSDPAGNLSSETAKTPPLTRRDASPSTVTYVLDQLVPFIVGAVAEGGKIRVDFNEPVTGTNSPTHWRVRSPDRVVTAVEGSGSSRTLTVTGDPIGGLVDYVPTTGRYEDEAGNPVPDTLGTVINGLPVPKVTVPSGPLVTRDTSVAVGGTARPGSTVVVFRDGQPGTPLASTTAGADGRWSLTAPLLTDQRNDLRVVSRASGQPDSASSAVPPVTQDATRPALSLTRPTGSEVLTSGSRSRTTWSTSDANPGTVLADISTDGGATWQSIGAVPAGSPGELDYTVPSVDAPAARVRLTSVDRAGNSTQTQSNPFRIDGITPRFDAVTATTRQVRVTFTEPVSGPVGEWRIDGQPAVLRSVDGNSSPALQLSGARVLLIEAVSAFGPDATPEVSYRPSPTGELRDSSTPGHVVAPVDRLRVAVDGIRPPVPTISAVDGARPQDGRVAGVEAAPPVVVDGLVSGHTVRIDRVSGGQTVSGLPVRVGSSQAAPRAPRMPADGEHVLRAVAVDPAGNQSTDADKAPGGQDGGPSEVVYVLDLPTELPPVRDVRISACPPDQVQPAGFVDTAESTFRFEIDCLAAYGFTRGVTSDRYGPAGNVTRAQMAIFVSRLARYGAVPLDTRDAGFTDLGAATREARDAVNALANLGVVKGVGPGRYDPASTITRGQMASFLARLQPAVGQPFPAGINAFDDDAGNVHEASIDAIAADGIVQGVSPRTYAPLAPVTRQQMAGFLTRYVGGRVEAGEMQSAYEPG